MILYENYVIIWNFHNTKDQTFPLLLCDHLYMYPSDLLAKNGNLVWVGSVAELRSLFSAIYGNRLALNHGSFQLPCWIK